MCKNYSKKLDSFALLCIKINNIDKYNHSFNNFKNSIINIKIV